MMSEQLSLFAETAVDRAAVVAFADKHGAAAAARSFGIPAATVRSWRHRARAPKAPRPDAGPAAPAREQPNRVPQATHAAASNGRGASDVRPLIGPQNGSYAAAVLDIATCSQCGAELSAGDIGQRRSRCGQCRAQRSRDIAAARDWRAATGPRRCECLRWAFSVNGDELGPRCGKCGGRHA